MIRLFLLYAILIFAKKAPKLIADLLKLDSKDGVGLKGLNIKNKMGEAALVGDKVKKGMTAAQGFATGAVGGTLGGVLPKFGQSFGKGFKDRMNQAKKDSEGKGLFKKIGIGARGVVSGIGKGGKSAFSKDNIKEMAKAGKKGFVAGSDAGAKKAIAQDGSMKGVFKSNFSDASLVSKDGNLSLLDKGKNFFKGLQESYQAQGYSTTEMARGNDLLDLRKKGAGLIGTTQNSRIIDAINEFNGGDQYDDAASHEAARKSAKSVADTTDGSYTMYKVKRDENNNPITNSKGEFIFDEIKVSSNGTRTFVDGGNKISVDKEGIVTVVDNDGNIIEGASAAGIFARCNSDSANYVRENAAVTIDTSAPMVDALQLKANIFNERQKVFDAMQQRLSELDSAGASKEEINAELKAIFAKKADLFSANAGNDVLLNIPRIEVSDIFVKSGGEEILDLSQYITANSKMQKGNDALMSGRENVESRKEAGKSGKDDEKK